MESTFSPNQAIEAANSLSNAVDWRQITDPQVIINARNDGLLGPALTKWLLEKGWLKISSVAYLRVSNIRRSGEEWLKGGMLLFDEKSKKMLESKDFDSALHDHGAIEIFTARELGIEDWRALDAYGEKGKKRLEHYGLEHCLMADAPKITTILHGRASGDQSVIHVLHEPCRCGEQRFGFTICFNDNVVRLRGFEIKLSQQTISPWHRIAVRRKQ